MLGSKLLFTLQVQLVTKFCGFPERLRVELRYNDRFFVPNVLPGSIISRQGGKSRLIQICDKFHFGTWVLEDSKMEKTFSRFI